MVGPEPQSAADKVDPFDHSRSKAESKVENLCLLGRNYAHVVNEL